MERTRRRKRNRKRAKFTVAINYRVVIVQNTLFVIWKIAKLILLVVSQLFSGLCFTHSLSIPVPHTHGNAKSLSLSLSLLLIAKCKSLSLSSYSTSGIIVWSQTVLQTTYIFFLFISFLISHYCVLLIHSFFLSLIHFLSLYLFSSRRG